MYLSKFCSQCYIPSDNPVWLLRLPDNVADNHYIPLIPTDGAPAPTAAKAYSICTSFPEGLNYKSQYHKTDYIQQITEINILRESLNLHSFNFSLY